MKEASVRKLVSLGASVILAWVFILYGWRKVSSDTAESQAQFMEWGYEPEFALQVGIAEMLGGLLLLFPPTTSLGALLLTVLMGGAIYTHVSTGIGSPVFPAVLLVCVLVLCVLRWPESFVRRIVRRSQAS
ncbi:MAG: DoxX family protein [Saprospiraceae bacterium]|nr:DoxX family protein [Saprospiraceae bacterium]